MEPLTLNINEASEIILLWFEQLFENEIEEAECAASNEHIWALGSDSQESAEQHEANADENREYIEYLKEALRQVREMLD